MKKATILMLAGSLIATTAVAQTPTRPSNSAPPVVANPSTGTVPGAGVVDRNTGTAAAAGDRNQAVTTTTANAPQPAKGANSFSSGEAHRRIESRGYTKVTDLKKDRDGIWRGTATKDGANVGVWLDYKGNVGAQ